MRGVFGRWLGFTGSGEYVPLFRTAAAAAAAALPSMAEGALVAAPDGVGMSCATSSANCVGLEAPSGSP